MLLTNPYVHVIALDFSKAFDTVRHTSVLDKLNLLNLPDHIHSWLVSYCEQHSHCTRHEGLISDINSISASVIQGSALGPAAFIVTSFDLTTTVTDNKMKKYADDCYLIIPASHSSSIPSELLHVGEWALVSSFFYPTRFICFRFFYSSYPKVPIFSLSTRSWKKSIYKK